MYLSVFSSESVLDSSDKSWPNVLVDINDAVSWSSTDTGVTRVES